MPARDLFHQAVRQALIKDGWTITDDPLLITFGGYDLYIDLGAERLIAAERGREVIAVEVKSFIGTSAVTEFHAALGQYLNYRLALEQQLPYRTLYLAVPKDTYASFFLSTFAQAACARYEVSMLTYDPQQEVIIQWTK